MEIFPYGEVEKAYLSKRCPNFKKLIKEMGHLQRPVTSDPFVALVNSIIAQQISAKAVKTICNRLKAHLVNINPQSILAATEEGLRSCGIPPRKQNYIKGIALAAQETINFQELALLPDTQIIKDLTALHGIGVWTVQMLLIFSFCRPNIISFDDLAIRNALMLLYDKESLTLAEFNTYKELYDPYASTASLYLWALAGQ